MAENITVWPSPSRVSTVPVQQIVYIEQSEQQALYTQEGVLLKQFGAQNTIADSDMVWPSPDKAFTVPV